MMADIAKSMSTFVLSLTTSPALAHILPLVLATVFFIFVSNTVSHTLSNVNVDTNINQSLSIHFLSVATEHPLHKNKQT